MSGADRPRTGLRLSTWLRLTLLASTALLGGVLLLYVVPQTSRTLDEHGDELGRQNSSTMRELAQVQVETTSKILNDLIGQGTRARINTLRDLPLETLGGDIAKIRAAIEAEEHLRSDTQRRNVALIATEMKARFDTRIADTLTALAVAQAQATRTATARLRTHNLVLVGCALLLLLLLLGVGLERLVVRPTRALRQATQRVAAGHLETEVPRPAASEIGDLTVDFADMLLALRSARGELQHLNNNLERTVLRKTEHLERALADLRSSHRQLAEAERLAALGTLAGGIAHEFHNVIGGIRGCTDELLIDETDASRRETMQVILRAAERASGIVQQLLRFARRSVETRGELDPSAIVNDALRLCEPGARRQGVQVERELATGLSLQGDGGALHQVVVNLLLNALQAMPTAGTLRVSVRAHATMAAIAVADTGSGIAPEHIEHVFEPFFTTREHDPDKPGTGLGLSVSYGIVAAHGGRIEVASTVGTGTTFTVLLPRSQPALPPGNPV